jgi:hypothetical protein
MQPNSIIMKYLALCVFLLHTLSACTKSETQYINLENKRETVNDKASDTIQTLNEISDTLQQEKESTNVKTDNE